MKTTWGQLKMKAAAVGLLCVLAVSVSSCTPDAGGESAVSSGKSGASGSFQLPDDYEPGANGESGVTGSGAASGGSSKSGSQDGSSKTGSGTTNASSKAGEDYTYKYRNVNMDLKGRVIKIANPKWWVPKNNNAYMGELLKRIDYYQKKWNFKLDYVFPAGESSEYHDKITQSVLSAKPLADVIWVESIYLFPGFLSGGIVQNVSSLGVFDFSHPKWNKTPMDVQGSFKGKYYMFEPKGFSANGYQYLGQGVFFNRDYFSRNSLPDLYDLVRKNEWTWDKMIEIAKAGTKEVGGKQVYGLTVWQDAFPFISSMGASIIKDTGNGTYKFDSTSSGLLTALNYYFANAATGPQNTGGAKYPWIHPHTGKWDFPMAAFKDGKAAMCATVFNAVDWYWSNLSFKWGFVPFPKYNKTTGKYGTSDLACSGWAMLSGINSPKDVAMVIDAITDAPVQKADYKDFYENIAQDKGTVDMIGIIINEGETRFDKFYCFPDVTQLFWDAWDTVRTGQATPASAMQSIMQPGQKKIDDTLQTLKNVK